MLIKNTEIFWNLTNYCTSDCSYCPSHLKYGSEPKHISEYLKIAKKLIDQYKLLNRKINWIFSGGELLELFDFPELLKLCKTSEGTIDITTNGGKIWLDWWAIEPYVDTLHLSYHYWQNSNLIKFIFQIFKKNNKQIEISVPLRPGENFYEDLKRAESISEELEFDIKKIPLYKDGSYMLGFLNYSDEQYEIMFGKEWLENFKTPLKTFKDISIEIRDSSPSFTGKLCNVGIEKLSISHDGWVSGSSCNNLHLGNIWNDNFQLPTGPTTCKMMSCSDASDQKITKFDP